MARTMRGIRLRNGPALVVFTCLVVLPGLAGCTLPESFASPPAPASGACIPPAPPPAPPAQPGQAPVAPATSAEVALRLEALLGKHAMLAVDLMRGRLRNDEDFAQAPNSAVGQNTADLTRTVAALCGEQPAGRFEGLWAEHVTALFNYSRGLATDDAAVRDEARNSLVGLNAELADLFATASQGRLDREAAQAELNTHEGHRNLADAFGATLAEQMPRGGAGTGAGGMAGALIPPPVVAPPGVQPAAPQVGRPAAPQVAQPAAKPFRSVRTYQEVAVPVRLRIPAVGVDTPLQRLGRAADRTVEVPSDFDVAGWFTGGPRPGQAGPAVVLGHVDSQRGPGVFFPLAGLAPGAAVHVDRADGSTATFRVTSVLTVPKSGFPTDLVYAPSLQPSLRLVTCGGTFDEATASYRDNIIVSADPLAGT
jgi:hypothetical protein